MSVETLAGGGDLRAATLLESLQEVMHERGKGMPIPTIIGVLELLKFDLMKKALNSEV